MTKISPYFFFVLLSSAVFFLVVTQTTPPQSLKEASFFQLASFFIPIATLVFSLSHLLSSQSIKSFGVTFGVLFFLFLRGWFKLELPIAVILSLAIMAPSFLIKRQESKKSYTKIPKLSELHKQR